MSLLIKKYKNNNQMSKAYGKTFGRATMIGTTSTEQLATMISETCTVTRHDIIAVLSALGPVMSRQMQNSFRVKLDYLGTFKLGVNSTGELDEEDYDVKKNVRGVHVIFHPETTVNVKGRWENALTRGVKVAELPKNLLNLAEINSDDEPGGGGGQSDEGEDRP